MRRIKKVRKEKRKKIKRLSPLEELQLVQKSLGYVAFQKEEESYPHLDTGYADLNEVFGDRDLGIRWGCIIELFGPESSGKTTVATAIGAIAQSKDKVHTYVAKGDLERTNDDRFNERMGIDMDRFYLFEARRVRYLKDKKKRKKETKAFADYMQSAENVCDEIERWIRMKRELDPEAKIVLIMDSVTGMLTAEEEDQGLSDQNMRSKVSLASFMSTLCRRWVRLAANYSVIVIFINQERTAPGVMFGDPTYTSGGRALKFYASTRVRCRRAKSGQIKKKGRIIGLRSILQNKKNKTGGMEFFSCGIKMYPRKGKVRVISRQQAEKEAKKKNADE